MQQTSTTAFARLRQLALIITTALVISACGTSPTEPSAAQAAFSHKATTPAPRDRDYEWMSLVNWHERFLDDVNAARDGDVDLLFLGDSITQGWPEEMFAHYFNQWRPANFGIGGDHTGNVLWRLQFGEVEKIQPRVVVLLIGINNFFHNGDQPDDVFQGVKAVVEKLQATWPDAKILLNGILPHQHAADHPMRQTIIDTNKMIKSLGDEQQIFYRDYGLLMLEADGTLSPRIMPDSLHPAEPGYKIWAEAMLPLLQSWLD